MKKLLYVLFAWLVAMQCAFAAININTASQEELDKLPGVGPVKAKAIVDDRTKNGPFKSVEDLKRVKGIGDATFDKLKGDISVSGASSGMKPEAKADEPKAEKKSAKKEKADKEAAAAKTEEKKDEAKDTAKEDKKAGKKSKKDKAEKADKEAAADKKDDKKSSKK